MRGDGSPVVGGHEPCGVVAAVGAGVEPSATAAKGSRLNANDGRWRVLRPGQDRKAFADDVVPSKACFAGARGRIPTGVYVTGADGTFRWIRHTTAVGNFDRGGLADPLKVQNA